ncbi:esterase/lipase family protein [Actinomycetospora cinnamomea]|uniref:Triacylglycerol esterase/lipase EstA (Alpha/beta hydrolase family) n=1 Tax=Actinomycetospora cinnamomea TaxID=663609 RepID=A0A2U1FIE0_9PSEU|nr:lipase [Actinomycetospora cinnamomea]PVZ11921.1 triacylglycerol esterase/lipase EstA (alpha/beta hydrolase family) [Actinomycetospora cinnamomea]
MASWPARAPLGGLAPRRRAFVLGLLAVGVVVAVLVGVGVAREYRVPPPADPEVPGAVVMVPGYGGNRAAFIALTERLRADDRRAVIVDLPSGGTGDLVTQAATVDDTVREVLDEGAPSVDVVGYSAGGVATRVYLDRGRTAPAVRRVVTLGSPLQGAELAAAGGALVPGACPRACQQLAPGSALLTDLATAPPGLPWLSIWTADDETVTPPDSAELPGTRSVRLQDVCSDSTVTHSRLPNDPLSVGLVLRALGSGPLPAADADQCDALRAEGRSGT